MEQPLLYIPIETKARELFGKTLLAAKAVERGWIVIIGGMVQVEDSLFRHPPGAYIEISIPEKKAENLAAYKAMGHSIVNLCEENIVYIDGKDYCDRKVGVGAAKTADLLFTSGTRNERDLRKHRHETAQKIRMVGNPRFDTLRPELRVVYESQAREIRRRFGRFLLVNTNFAYIHNCFKPGDNYIGMLKRRGMITDESHEQFKQREVERKGKQLELFRALLTKLARANAFDRIVVRPHPSENHDFWQWGQALGMDIRYEKNANIWMLAADAILHTGCTTGIEGLLLDRPVATFLPDPGNEFLNQADEVSVPVTDAQSFLDYTAEIRNLSPEQLRDKLTEQREATKKYICNVDPPLSVDRILDALQELDVPEFCSRQAGLAIQGIMKERTINALGGMKSTVNTVIRRSSRSKGRKQKFPYLHGRELNILTREWQRAGILKHVPRVRKLGNALYLMTGT